VRRRPSATTPRQRKMMLGGAALLIVIAVLLPSFGGPEEQAEVKPQIPPPPPPPPGVVTGPQAVRTRPAAAARDSAGSLPLLTSLAPGVASNAEETKLRVATLQPYFEQQSSKQRELAYKHLVELGPLLSELLPKLIEESEGPALYHYVRAARELKAVATVPALIARMENPDKRQTPRTALFEALAGFDDPRAQAYVLTAMEGKSKLPSDVVWDTVGEKFDEKQLALAIAKVAEGGPDSPAAAKAVGRYGNNNEKARAVIERLQPLIQEKKGAARLAVLAAVASVDPATAANALIGYGYDPDPAVRAIVQGTLARSPTHRPTAIAALQNEKDATVRGAIVEGLAQKPDELTLPVLVQLLKDPQVSSIAHRALVLETKGQDFGNQELVWRQWLLLRLPQLQSRPKQGLDPLDVPDFSPDAEPETSK
jgi:HEAT repeat protein